MTSDYSGYKRGLLRYFEREGIERVDRQIQEMFDPRDPQSRTHRIQAYLRDSLLWSIEELEAGHPIYAFRGLVQAAGYAGQVGHDSLTGDTFNTLKNDIEDALRAAERVEYEMSQVLDDAYKERTDQRLVEVVQMLLEEIVDEDEDGYALASVARAKEVLRMVGVKP